ncbi:MAG: PAS domain S-box protein [Candidatus Cloacimonetes bacterium]|nr:PAS domain S-box protein [Candidatus Cloacimonadota bacterium]
MIKTIYLILFTLLFCFLSGANTSDVFVLHSYSSHYRYINDFNSSLLNLHTEALANSEYSYRFHFYYLDYNNLSESSQGLSEFILDKINYVNPFAIITFELPAFYFIREYDTNISENVSLISCGIYSEADKNWSTERKWTKIIPDISLKDNFSFLDTFTEELESIVIFSDSTDTDNHFFAAQIHSFLSSEFGNFGLHTLNLDNPIYMKMRLSEISKPRLFIFSNPRIAEDIFGDNYTNQIMDLSFSNSTIVSFWNNFDHQNFIGGNIFSNGRRAELIVNALNKLQNDTAKSIEIAEHPVISWNPTGIINSGWNLKSFSSETKTFNKFTSKGKWFAILLVSGYIILIVASFLFIKSKFGINSKAHLVMMHNLTEFQEKLQNMNRLFNSLPESVVIFNSRGKIIEINSGFTSLTGFSAEEAKQIYLTDIFHSQEKEKVINYLNELILKGNEASFDSKLNTADKTEFINIQIFELSKDSFFAYIKDITEFRNTISSLKDSQQMFSIIAEKSMVGIFLIKDGRFDYINPVMRKIMHAHDNQLSTSISIKELVHPDDWDEIDNFFLEDFLSHDINQHFRFRLMDLEKNIHRVETYTSRTTEGSTNIVIGTIIDITEREKTELELRESLKLNKTIISHLPIGISVRDKNGRLLLVNDVWKSIWAIDENTIKIDSSCKKELAFNKRDQYLGNHTNSVKNVYENGGEYFIPELELKKDKPGKAEWVAQRFCAIEDESGSVSKVLILTEDITTRKKEEAKLRQSQKMEAVGTLAGGIAHDFNNLLTIINGYTEILQKSVKDSRSEKLLNEISKAGRKAAELTHQLLAFSRKGMITPKIIGINDLIKNLHKMLRRLIPEDIELELKLTEGLPVIKADLTQIEQILINLVVNSKDAIKEKHSLVNKGKIQIRTESETHYDELISVPRHFIKIVISDNGIGIPPEIINNIFDPFFTTKDVGKGTGLGLSMVYGIIKQNNAMIEVFSEPHEGTTFKILWPSAEEITSLPIETETDIVNGNREVILVVEDDLGVKSVAAKMLMQWNYEVIDAADGEEALTKAKEIDKIDLLFTDIVMPEISGYQLADILSERFPNMKVILTTGYTEQMLQLKDKKIKYSYIMKPYSAKEFSDAVQKVLKKKQGD